MRELDIYIKSKKAFGQFVKDFNMLFNLDLKIEENSDGYFCHYFCLDIESLLCDSHNMEDDLGIPFSDYSYCLSLIKLNRGGTKQEYNDLYISMAKYYTEKISSVLHENCILVEDSQRILMKR